MKIPHLFKRGGTYNFRQRVPQDLKHFFKQLSITRSLKTKDYATAVSAWQDMAARYDALWAQLRDPAAMAEVEADRIMEKLGAKPGDCEHGSPSFNYGIARAWAEHMIDGGGFEKVKPADKVVARRLFHPPVKAPEHTLSQALALYLRYHTRGKDPKFVKERERPIKYAIDAIGDLPLDQITRAHARKVCEALMQTGMKTKSVRTYLGIVSATINKARTEWEMACANNFEKLDIPGEKLDDTEVEPFTASELKIIHAGCLAKDDDISWVAAILLETGARVSEVAGLRADDIHLGGPIPFVSFKGNERRTVKTAGSDRSIHH
jgi:hypothetical protein